jgi:hypothetical protein
VRPSGPLKGGFTWASAWGILGVLAVLGNALKRLLPIALEPFRRGDFTPLNWYFVLPDDC